LKGYAYQPITEPLAQIRLTFFKKLNFILENVIKFI